MPLRSCTLRSHVAGSCSHRTWLPRRHDPDLFAALDGYWKAEPADHVVATGDISTDGQVQSLEAARQFLTGAVPRPARRRDRLGPRGPGQALLVPGNHDRYAGRYLPISNQITNFESVFGDRFEIAVARARRLVDIEDLRLRVLAIDSMGDAGCLVAKGKVHDDDLDWLQTVYDDDTRREEHCDLRLLLLHHHVAIPDSHRFNRWTRLKNVTDALESMLRADIDLVMFGHEHYHYVGERTYSDLIGDRRIRRRLAKTHQLEKRLITCMCGTTTCDDGGRNLAWRVVIDRRGDRYHLRFVLLEADRTAAP
jgi:3',5'-cyclic AMP phosphodiesterase CpdA